MTNEVDKARQNLQSNVPHSDDSLKATGVFHLIVVPDVSDNNAIVTEDVVELMNNIGRDGAGDAIEALVTGQGHESHQGRVTRPVPLRRQGEPVVDVRIQEGTIIQTSEIEPSQDPLEVAQRPVSAITPTSQAIDFRGSRREFIVKMISRDSIDKLGLRGIVAPTRKRAA